MLSKKILLLSSILAILAFSSCTKEIIGNDTNEITGTWEVVSIQSDIPYDWDNDGFQETDIYNTYNYCQQDIQMIFERDDYGQTRQGCNAAWENIDWQLSNNRLYIHMYTDDINLYLTQFDGNTIRGYDPVYVNGRTYNITYTLRKRY